VIALAGIFVTSVRFTFDHNQFSVNNFGSNVSGTTVVSVAPVFGLITFVVVLPDVPAASLIFAAKSVFSSGVRLFTSKPIDSAILLR